jgi:hypothetical protein
MEGRRGKKRRFSLTEWEECEWKKKRVKGSWKEGRRALGEMGQNVVKNEWKCGRRREERLLPAVPSSQGLEAVFFQTVWLPRGGQW